MKAAISPSFRFRRMANDAVVAGPATDASPVGLLSLGGADAGTESGREPGGSQVGVSAGIGILAPDAPAPELVSVEGVQVAPVLVPYVRALREAARRLGATFRVTSGYRSPAQQRALQMRWEAGDPSVVYPPAANSYHLEGLAVDVESSRLNDLGYIMEKLGMRWGGRYGDPVHFDLGRTT